jgi:hypothetical protein
MISTLAMSFFSSVAFSSSSWNKSEYSEISSLLRILEVSFYSWKEVFLEYGLFRYGWEMVLMAALSLRLLPVERDIALVYSWPLLASGLPKVSAMFFFFIEGGLSFIGSIYAGFCLVGLEARPALGSWCVTRVSRFDYARHCVSYR